MKLICKNCGQFLNFYQFIGGFSKGKFFEVEECQCSTEKYEEIKEKCQNFDFEAAEASVLISKLEDKIREIKKIIEKP